MDLVYREKTLHVRLDEDLNSKVIKNFERRLDRILRDYNIENVEISLKQKKPIKGFENSINNIKNNHSSNIYFK